MYNLKIIIASTRPGRKGPLFASWMLEISRKHPDFNVELLDLAEINLPFFDEPNHPGIQQYHHEHTKSWSRQVASADAFIFVTPEYNYGFPATLKNAIDYLSVEWAYKPVGFVSYGGVAAGTRAVQMLKQIVTTLKMVPVVESVNIPYFFKHINQEGNFIAEETMNKTAEDMLAEILKWTESLVIMREKQLTNLT